MAEPVVRTDAFSAPLKRSTGSKFNRAWLVMLSAGLVAFMLFFAATSENKSTVPVLVANRDIAQGETFSVNDFTRASVHLQGTSSSQLFVVSNSSLKDAVGHSAVRPLSKGSILVSTDFQNSTADNSQRWLSFEIDNANAVGGDISVNTDVDMFNRCGVEVGHKLHVVKVNRGSGSSSLSGSSNGKILVTLAVDNDQIGAVSQQTLGDKFQLVKNNNQKDLRPAQIIPCGSNGAK